MIIGDGDVANRVGKTLKLSDANVTYLQKEDKLNQVIKDFDIIINTLDSKSITKELFNNIFFESLKNIQLFSQFRFLIPFPLPIQAFFLLFLYRNNCA